MLVFIMQITETWEMLFSFDSRVGDTLLSTPGHAGLIFQPKVKQPRNNINETEKTCELCWCLLISGPRTIRLLPCPATEFLLIMWLGNLKVYLIFDAVIHISHGRISFVFKEIMVSRSGGTREYVNFQVPPPHPIPSHGEMGRNQTRSTWSMPIAFPQGGIQTYIADYISHQKRCDGVCILWISPWGKCKSRWLHACPPKQKSQNARQKC